MAKKINFFDGAESETTPTVGNISTSELIQYDSDASYEAANQGAPYEGNIYFNTTSKRARYYTGTEWTEIADISSPQTFTNKTLDGTQNTIQNVDGDAVIIDAAGNLPLGTAQSTAEAHQLVLDNHEGRITTNETAIANHETRITTNEGNIATNTTNIASNTTRITTNEGNIAANTAAIAGKLDAAEKGAPNGVATLDGNGLVPASQLPSYVDDVLEFADLASFPAIGELGKIYVALDTNFLYRWTGSVYIDITGKVDSVNGQVGAVVLDTDDIAEGALNKYYTEAAFNASLATKTTDDLAEGTINLYYTDARVAAAPEVVANTAKVSADGSISTHSDVDTTTVPPVEGNALVWNGTQWVPGEGAGAGGAGNVNWSANPFFAKDLVGVTSSDDVNLLISRTELAGEVQLPHISDGSLKVEKAALDLSGQYVQITDNAQIAPYLVDQFKAVVKVKVDTSLDANYVHDSFVIDVVNGAGDSLTIGGPVAIAAGTNREYQVLINPNGQTDIDTRIRCVSTNTTAYSFIVGSHAIEELGQVVVDGQNEWEEVTITGTWTSNVIYVGRRKKVGDTAFYDISVQCTGAPNASNLFIDIPDTIDISKLSNPFSRNASIGTVSICDAPSDIRIGSIRWNTETRIQPLYTVSSLGQQATISNTAPFTFVSGDRVDMRFSVPVIDKVASNTLTNFELGLQTASTSLTKSASQSIPTGVFTQITFDGAENDLFGMQDGNSLVAKQDFRGTVFGLIDVEHPSGSGVMVAQIRVNGSFIATNSNSLSSSINPNYIQVSSNPRNFKKGDVFTLFFWQNSGGNRAVNPLNLTRLSVTQIPDFTLYNAVPAYDGTLQNIYVTLQAESGVQLIPNNSDTVVAFPSSVGPSNWVTGNTIVVQKRIKAVLKSAIVWGNNPVGNRGLYIRVNGTRVAQDYKSFQDNTPAGTWQYVETGRPVQLEVGDLIDVQAFQDTGAGLNLVGATATTPRYLTMVQVPDVNFYEADAKKALNAQGAAPIYAARGFVRFNGVTMDIINSANVASVARSGIGSYLITFTEQLPFPPTVTTASRAGGGSGDKGPYVANATTTEIQIFTYNSAGSFVDSGDVHVVFFA